MANIEQGNQYLELKQRTDRDVRQLGPISSQYYDAESTAGQTVIPLSFAVEQTTVGKKQVLLIVDGKILREGAGNDYTYINAQAGQSSQIQLAAPLAAGLNIMAYRIGAAIQTFPTPATVQATLNNDVGAPAAMASAGFNNFIAPAYITAPFTQIQRRAQVLDDSATLRAIAGVERIYITNLFQVNEFGPAGERVFEINNKDSRIRFVGAWNSISTGNGTYAEANMATDFVEVTFYGTGLNLYTNLNGFSRDFRVTVDGGTESANVYAGNGGSTVLSNRNYPARNIQTITSGLTLGLHTVKIRLGSAIQTQINGFEILNERTDLAVLSGTAFAGTKREVLPALSASAFNAGVAGVRGARVVKYILNGVISQVVQETNASSAFLGASDHTNEEIIRVFNWREFGANRADDFSTLSTARSAHFTMEDGATSLAGLTVVAQTVNGQDVVIPNTSNTYLVFTFVGTGLDITSSTGASTVDGFQVFVDGVSVGTSLQPSNSYGGVTKICSGLPYGTHTVRFLRTAVTGNSNTLADLIVYGPKKPAIPAGAIEVADYNVLASYVANTVQGQLNSATGILRKHAAREITYIGSWTYNQDLGSISGGYSVCTGNTDYVENTFWGTGVEFRFIQTTTSPSGSVVTLVNINTGATINLGTVTTGVYGTGVTFNATTGVLNQVGATTLYGAGLRISGLPLGMYKIRVTKTNGTNMLVEALDVISPIFISKSGSKATNNLASNRTFSPIPTAVNTLPDLGKAKAIVAYDTATQTILYSYNISAALKKGTGYANFYFEKPFKPGRIVPIALGNIAQVDIDTLTPTYLDMGINSSSGVLTDGQIYIVVYGELIDE